VHLKLDLGGSDEMTRPHRNEEDLKAALKHLCYEIDMLQGTMERLETGSTEDRILHNALVESFTVHARNLMHFLYPIGEKDSDVLAADFFDDAGYWLKNRPEEPKEFGKSRGRVNKEIAHLTYDRLSVTPQHKIWNPALGDEILRIMAIFFSALPQRFRNTNQRNVTSQMQARVFSGVISYTTQDIHPTI
jgi:hypothetical protein